MQWGIRDNRARSSGKPIDLIRRSLDSGTPLVGDIVPPPLLPVRAERRTSRSLVPFTSAALSRVTRQALVLLPRFNVPSDLFACWKRVCSRILAYALVPIDRCFLYEGQSAWPRSAQGTVALKIFYCAWWGQDSLLLVTVRTR